jgi:hypothetical protein
MAIVTIDSPIAADTLTALRSLRAIEEIRQVRL